MKKNRLTESWIFITLTNRQPDSTKKETITTETNLFCSKYCVFMNKIMIFADKNIAVSNKNWVEYHLRMSSVNISIRPMKPNDVN